MQRVESQIAARLHILNKQFYQTFGKEFSSTRQRLQPGVIKILDRLKGGESILDLGCGNGELARELLRRNFGGRYVGLDFSPPLLDAARESREDVPLTFLKADLFSGDWAEQVAAISERPFDWATSFAVLHHIPGEQARLNILNKTHALLCEGGLFIHSEWQFLNSDKLKKRIQPWEQVGLSTDDVNPGDTLLDWRSGGRGLRYVHHFDEMELQALAAASHFQVRETFLSDGVNGRLGLYQVWQAIQ